MRPRQWLALMTQTRATISFAQNVNLQIGEEIDFFPQPGTKDASGWYWPATVVDVSKAARGVITLRFQNQVTEAMIQNVRRHLHFGRISQLLFEGRFMPPVCGTR